MTIKRNNLLPAMLLTGMALGTAWAIRGSFGHEYGAAWAGGIGALAILLLAKRDDWYNKFLPATVAAALGWGIGGIISYGLEVGYGHGNDFGNVYYGLTMLLVIGGLFGWIGGGLFGLALANKPGKKVQWPMLIVEMTIGGLIFYYFMINEFEWLMNPPRGEEWSACLGMAFALTWHLYRNGYEAPIRVAFYSAIGAGFGFAFGNFLQVLGRSADIHTLNFWNVMEYSIGFFGGLGMAYGTFTANWEPVPTKPTKQGVLTPLVIIGLVIPFLVWDQSFNLAHSDPNAASASLPYMQWITLGLVLVFFAAALKKYYIDINDQLTNFAFRSVFIFFVADLFFYIIYHFLVSGSWQHGLSIEQSLYLLNLVGLMYFLPKIRAGFNSKERRTGTWVGFLLLVILFLAILAMIAINAHGDFPNMQKRFPSTR